jgi:hypothetical protein
VFRHDIDGDQILTANQSAEDTLQPQILVAFPQRNVELAQIPYRKVTSEQRQPLAGVAPRCAIEFTGMKLTSVKDTQEQIVPW